MLDHYEITVIDFKRVSLLFKQCYWTKTFMMVSDRKMLMAEKGIILNQIDFHYWLSKIKSLIYLRHEPAKKNPQDIRNAVFTKKLSNFSIGLNNEFFDLLWNDSARRVPGEWTLVAVWEGWQCRGCCDTDMDSLLLASITYWTKYRVTLGGRNCDCKILRLLFCFINGSLL